MPTRKQLTVQIAAKEINSGLLLRNVRACVEQYLRFCPNKIKEDPFKGGNVAVHEYALKSVTEACVEILLHSLRLVGDKHAWTLSTSCNISENTSADPDVVTRSTADESTLQKLIEDFEWLRRSTQIGETLASDTCDDITSPQNTNNCSHATVQQFLIRWTLRNLRSNCLCACLQALGSDKELLECHYVKGAFLRNELYATAFFVCLSALELDQCSLLTQVQPELCSPTATGAFGAFSGALHKRTNSYPGFLVPTATANSSGALGPSKENKKSSTKLTLHSESTVFSRFCKVKSLPLLLNMHMEVKESGSEVTQFRPRSKTLNAAITTPLAAPTQPKNIPTTILKRPMVSSSNTTSSSSYNGFEDDQPSTSSAHSKTSNLSFYAKVSPSNFNTSLATAASSSTSASSTNSTTAARHIDLIKCDNIKIWTDQSWEFKQQQQKEQNQPQSTPRQTVASCAIQDNSLVINCKQSKSISPINNFLCHLFGTSPTYTSWSNSGFMSSNDETEPTPTSALDAASYPCNNAHQLGVSNSSGMFDSFLPVYGKKLRSRKSQNLFDEGAISSLDYSSTVADNSTVDTMTGIGDDTPPTATKMPPKDCQSLTVFLQMAHFSTQRNNTELEKENAHFRISEAIISAIEHIKWTKQEPERFRRESETITATDWLENDRDTQYNVDSPSSLSPVEANEHIPYAELEECSLDALSAEVVGLSLIAKFNEKHLPKVSELKWLVSEEDAPQQLLPLPDASSTANPDEHMVPSITRGTRYWAPPRQQIIFTDYPPPNRKELIRKQNKRCAGCGMRVSPQYIQSFRYCTYLGKYHCTGCHRNQMSAIPAKILQSWDFKCYPVSVFAYRLLEQMYTYPLFHVPDLNPALYIHNKVLLTARNKRIHLKFVKDFIKTCRFAVREQRYFDSVPTHITDDPDIWSMLDFINAHEKSMKHFIDELILRCENHIFNCALCTGRGFVCEFCHNIQAIYPWQSKVFRCDRCGSCFHQKCWKAMREICCKCQRINKRQVEINDIEYELQAKMT